MIAYWVDANVLIRFLTDDPPEMAERAEHLLRRAERAELLLLVHPIVVAEVVWVLQSFYGHPRDRIACQLLPLLDRPGMRIQQSKAVIGAISAMAQRNVDFADALLAELARARGQGVATFDRDFRRLKVEQLEP